MTFTHYDFSPRNILVSEGSPPLVTSVLDFEFAGFFPNEDQFTNNAIANNQDWPEAAYRVFSGGTGEAWREDTSARH